MSVKQVRHTVALSHTVSEYVKALNQCYMYERARYAFSLFHSALLAAIARSGIACLHHTCMMSSRVRGRVIVRVVDHSRSMQVLPGVAWLLEKL